MAMIECSNCGKPVSDGSPYCPHCGGRIPRRPAPFETDPAARRERRWRGLRNLSFALGLASSFYALGVYAFASPPPPSRTPLWMAGAFWVGWAYSVWAHRCAIRGAGPKR